METAAESLLDTVQPPPGGGGCLLCKEDQRAKNEVVTTATMIWKMKEEMCKSLR